MLFLQQQMASVGLMNSVARAPLLLAKLDRRGKQQLTVPFVFILAFIFELIIAGGDYPVAFSQSLQYFNIAWILTAGSYAGSIR